MIRCSSNSRPKFTIEVVDDPAETARHHALMAQHKRNSDWLSSHWPELLPDARGRFVAVADQEAFVADSIEEAWAWVDHVHPQDGGAIVQYVRPERGPRIYSC